METYLNFLKMNINRKTPLTHLKLVPEIDKTHFKCLLQNETMS